MEQSIKNWRVSKSRPCPICGKPDWCLILPNGDVVCRIDNGNPWGDSGCFLHKIGNNPDIKVEKFKIPPKVIRDFTQEVAQFYKDRKFFGVVPPVCSDESVLDKYWVGYNQVNKDFLFPMFDENHKPIGIKRRTITGNKLCITGSSNGLYLPNTKPDGFVIMPEGESDTLAASELGFFAAGRPNCSAGKDLIKAYLRKNYCHTVVIFYDNDPVKNERRAGEHGARQIAEHIKGVCKELKLVAPPKKYKDLRDWYEAGLTKTSLNFYINSHRSFK